MPELPEVENIAQGLRKEIISLGIKNIHVAQPVIIRGRYRSTWRKSLSDYMDYSIAKVTRRGKRLIIILNNQRALLIQLGMTGSFILSDRRVRRQKHTHFYITLSDETELRFVDPRRFGKLWLLDEVDDRNPDAAMETAGLSRLGPEPFDITRKDFRNLLDHSKRPIKSLLLDQVRIAGLGNIYADESLFAAFIHPATVCDKITPEQADLLRRKIRAILKKAIAHGGTTFSDFRNAYGDMGRFLKMLKVYRRTALPCCRCQTPIARMVISGRSSHFCPQCQS